MDHITPDPERSGVPDPRPDIAVLAGIGTDFEPIEQILRRIADLAKQTMGGVGEVSLTLIEARRPRSLVSTGRLAVELDDRQYEAGFGPCLDAAKSGQTIVVDCTQDDTPYVDFARAAGRAGVRHIISVGMPLAQRTIGCLNIYRAAEEPISPVFLEHAQLFAHHAAVATNRTGSTDPDQGGNSEMTVHRVDAVLEQAKGIIMARYRCTADEAHDLLIRTSRQRIATLDEVVRTTIASTTT